MTLRTRLRETRGLPLSAGGWGGWMSDPAVIPPNSVYNVSSAGVIVNERSVMSLMVVASCIRIIGDTVSGLTPRVYKMEGTRRSRGDVEVDPPEVIVNPYADMDREEGDFKRIASLGLNGNFYVHIVDRNSRGLPTQVEILNPSAVHVDMRDGVKQYRVGQYYLNPDDVIHVPWISLAGGIVGVNPIEIGAIGFGLPIAANEYAARYFAQGMHPTGILSIDKPTAPEDLRRIQQELLVRHGGLAQSHAPIVLDASTKWQQISITPETAQLLQTRAFSRQEIAGFYGVPGHLIGDVPDNGGPWGKGLQEMVMGFALFSLSGYARRLDRADTRLLPPGYYVRREVADLFKTNDDMLAKYVASLRMNAVATPNEVRAIVGLPPINEVGADSLFAPINSAHSDWMATVHGGAVAEDEKQGSD